MSNLKVVLLGSAPLHDVDFALKRGERTIAIEVKSGRKKDVLSGVSKIRSAHTIDRTFLVGQDGIPLEEFFLRPLEEFF